MFDEHAKARDVLVRIVVDPKLSWRATGLAGRGISADATFTQWAVETGKPSLAGEELFETLMSFSDIVDNLIQLWNSYERGELPAKDVDNILEGLVSQMEEFASK